MSYTLDANEVLGETVPDETRLPEDTFKRYLQDIQKSSKK